MIANIFYQKDITRRIQSIYSSVSSVQANRRFAPCPNNKPHRVAVSMSKCTTL